MKCSFRPGLWHYYTLVCIITWLWPGIREPLNFHDLSYNRGSMQDIIQFMLHLYTLELSTHWFLPPATQATRAAWFTAAWCRMSRSYTKSIHIIIDSLLHIITQNQCPGPIFFTRPNLSYQAQSSVMTHYYAILFLHSCIIITVLLRIMAYYTICFYIIITYYYVLLHGYYQGSGSP